MLMCDHMLSFRRHIQTLQVIKHEIRDMQTLSCLSVAKTEAFIKNGISHVTKLVCQN